MVIALGCSHTNESEWPKDIAFTLEEGTIVRMDSEIVDFSYDFFRAQKFFVYSDSLLVILNRPEENHTIVEIANLKTGEVLAETLMYGNGPLEALLSISPQLRGSILYIKDAVRRRLMAVDVAEAVHNPSGYHPEVIDDYSGVPATFVTTLDDDTIIYENSYCFEDKNADITNEGQERLIFAQRGNHGPISVGSPKYDTYNVSQGFIVPIKEENRIFFADLSLPVLELYDCTGKKIRRMNGPTELPAEYGVRDGCVINKGKVPYAYLYACEHKGKFYANYIGGYYMHSYNDLHSTILEFDLDGNLLKSYVSPVFLSTFSITSDGTIYGQGYDETKTVVLWKLTPHV